MTIICYIYIYYRIEVNYYSIFLGVTLDKHTYPETKGFPYRVCQPICGDQDELGDWELETMAMTVAILHLHPSTTYKLHTPGESIYRLQVVNTLRSSSSSSFNLFRSWSSSCLWAWNVATHTHTQFSWHFPMVFTGNQLHNTPTPLPLASKNAQLQPVVDNLRPSLARFPPISKRQKRVTSPHRIYGAGIYANIGGIVMANVTIYGIHGSYGIGVSTSWKIATAWWFLKKNPFQ